MSLIFNGTTQYCTADSFTSWTTNIGIAAWVKRDVSNGVIATAGAGADPDNRYWIGLTTTERCTCGAKASALQSVITSSNNVTTEGAWESVIGRFISNSSRVLYANTVNQGTNATSRVVTPTRFTLAATNDFTSKLAGRLTYVTVFTYTDVTDFTNFASQFENTNPLDITAGTLLHCWGPDCQTDLVGSFNLTAVGSPSTSTDEPTHLIAPVSAVRTITRNVCRTIFIPKGCIQRQNRVAGEIELPP